MKNQSSNSTSCGDITLRLLVHVSFHKKIAISGYPIMHRISCLDLAWHWNVVCVHVHLRSHSMMVCLVGVLLRLPTLVNVKKRVFLLAWNVLVMRCTTLLCRVILRPFKYGCSHVERRWGHATLSLQLHNRVIL